MPNKFIGEIFRDVTALGSIYFAISLLAITFWLEEYSLTQKLLIGIIITFIVTSGIKYFFFKNRPKKETYHNIAEKIDASSFPSLHTARAIFIVLLFSYHFYDVLLTIIFFSLAFLVAYSRIYLKKHFLTDIAGGIVLGAVTFLITTVF